MLKMIHRKSLYNRYRYISDSIGKDKSVFELGCGTAFLHGFLHKSCNYAGWDLNRRFIEHCKNNGINATEKDIFDFDDYPKNDVTIVCDVLHHVFPKDRQLIKNAMKNTKKLIIVEPYHVKPKVPNFILKKLRFLDEDGVNEDKARYMWNFERCGELIDHFKKNVRTETKQIGLDVVATFDSAGSC
jgi:SAM-dependent methyltransferase